MDPVLVVLLFLLPVTQESDAEVYLPHFDICFCFVLALPKVIEWIYFKENNDDEFVTIVQNNQIVAYDGFTL